MSHSDDAILMQMRETSDYKLGYAMSSIRTALWYLSKGLVEQAEKELHNTVSTIRTTAEV
jgi:hypothetical protein